MALLSRLRTKKPILRPLSKLFRRPAADSVVPPPTSRLAPPPEPPVLLGSAPPGTCLQPLLLPLLPARLFWGSVRPRCAPAFAAEYARRALREHQSDPKDRGPTWAAAGELWPDSRCRR
eukprot:scaffold109_cov252-Pinguiococcus_pyrenoidosus.AAC.18